MGKEPNPPRQKMAKQLAQKAQRDRKKKQDKLVKVSREKGESGRVTQEEVDRSFLRDYLDSMSTFLPRKGIRRSMPSVPPRPPSQWRSFPMRVPGRSEIGWMPPDGMGDVRNPASLKSDRPIELPLARALVMKFLHKEILQFSDYVGLSAHETAQREGVLGEIHDAIKAKYGPDVVVSAFGSYASGLSIFDSDLDVTVEGLGIAIDDKGKQVAPSSDAKLGLCVLTSAGSARRVNGKSEGQEKGAWEEKGAEWDPHHHGQDNPRTDSAEKEELESLDGSEEKNENGDEDEDEEEVTFEIDRSGEGRPEVIDLTGNTPEMAVDEGSDDKTKKRKRWDRDGGGDGEEEEEEEREAALARAEAALEPYVHPLPAGGQGREVVVVGSDTEEEAEEGRPQASTLPFFEDTDSDSDDGGGGEEDEEEDGGDIMARKGAVTGRVVTTAASKEGSGVVHVRYEGGGGAGQSTVDIDCGVLAPSSSRQNSGGSGGTRSSAISVEADPGGLREAVAAASSSSSSSSSTSTSTSTSSGGGTRSLRLTNGVTVQVHTQYASNVAMLVPQSAKGQQRVQAELKARGSTTTYLSGLHGFLQQCGWIDASEFRARAKVPIIALRHKSGIEADISLGVNAATHSEVVQDLVSLVGRAVFVPLSRLLKVFLGSLGADKPFNGGIGSFKLYVMIAHVYSTVAGAGAGSGKIARDDPDVGLAYLLRLFFHYFGSAQNLQKSTTIQVRGAVVTFDTTNVPSMRELFRAAGDALDGAIAREAAKLSASHKKGGGAGAGAGAGVGGKGRGQGYEFSGVLPVVVNATSLGARRLQVARRGDQYYRLASRGKGKGQADDPSSSSDALAGFIFHQKCQRFSAMLGDLHGQVCKKRGLPAGVTVTGNGAVDSVFGAGAVDAAGVQKIWEAHPTIAARVTSMAFVESGSSSSSSSTSGNGNKKRRVNLNGAGSNGSGRFNFKAGLGAKKGNGSSSSSSGSGSGSSSSSSRKKAKDRYPSGVTGNKIKDFEKRKLKATQKGGKKAWV